MEPSRRGKADACRVVRGPSRTLPAPATRRPPDQDAWLTNRLVNGDKLGPVGKGTLHLNFLDHLRHALHHVFATEDAEPGLHQLRHAPPIADALEDLRGDQRERLGMVELETAAAASPREFGRGEDEQLLLLT